MEPSKNNKKKEDEFSKEIDASLSKESFGIGFKRILGEGWNNDRVLREFHQGGDDLSLL